MGLALLGWRLDSDDLQKHASQMCHLVIPTGYIRKTRQFIVAICFFSQGV